MSRLQTNSVKHVDPECVYFSLYRPDEIRKMSVAKINVPVSFNALGVPLKGGLYDPLMGPSLVGGDLCGTCQRAYSSCPGHFGHIELPVPVFNPLFLKTIFTILRLACLKCHELQLPGQIRHFLVTQLRLLDTGHVVEAQDLMSKFNVASAISNSNTVSEAASSAYAQETFTEYAAKILASPETQHLADAEYKNTEVLRAQYLAMAKDQFKQRKVCWSCRKPITKITLVNNKIWGTFHPEQAKEGKVVSRSTPQFVTPEEVRSHLRSLWNKYSDFILALAPTLREISTEYPTDNFFIEVVPVPPPKVRPITIIRGKRNEHPQTMAFQQVLEHSLVARQAAHIIKGGSKEELSEEGRQMYETMSGETPLQKFHNACQWLQTSVDHLVDAEMNNSGKLGKTRTAGLKQVISKKEGLIRMHMMGKRVNFAARTVITPDPNIGVDEIGIPETFAKVLTYPTPVTPWNVDDLRMAILNGPNVYPGATMVQLECGTVVRVGLEETQRKSLAKRLLTPTESNGKRPLYPKIVHRHLHNGDVLLLNRQPTLHRPSIMAHRAHILRGEKTFRLHYANCKSYNADFDGDEMNAHFPQSELGRAEAYFLAQVGHQYLVPKDGSPLSGLIQDHVVSGVRLTIRGRFFTRAEYCLLLQHALPRLVGNTRLLPPAMLKPRLLWSGKQLLSTVLLNCIPQGRPPLTLHDSAKISAPAWINKGGPRSWKAGGTPLKHDAMSEAEVVIRDGELLCGVLDKKHFGSTPYGLAHCVYELYGGDACMKLLSAFARLFTAFLQREGFTLGVRDILVVPEADAKRKKMLDGVSHIGPSAVAAAFDLSSASTDIINHEEKLPSDAEIKLGRIAAGDKKLSATLDHSYKQLLDPATNAVSRTCVPAGLLECFPNNNLQLMVQSGAKGSTVNTLQISCLLGQIELEGRRPPLMPSGKSLPSFRRFDSSPRAGGFIAGRFLTGIQPQEFFFHCMAGREGLIDTAVKTSRSGYLQRCLIKHLEGLVVSYDGTVRDSDGSVVQFAYGEDGLDILRSRFFTPKQVHVLAENYKAFFCENDVLKLKGPGLDKDTAKALKEVHHWQRKVRGLTTSRSLRKAGSFPRTPDPVASRVPPCASFEVLTESLEELINGYMKSRMSACTNVRNALMAKGVFARADPGEPVGVLAAQSIGEPSTQMTLNTFHFAGRGEMNVTLGIPRLREVLMMASKNPKTPSMEVPIRSDIPNPESAADYLRRRLHRTVLAELLHDVRIKEWIEVNKDGRCRLYQMHIQLLPPKVLRRELSVTPHQALLHIERKFLAQLFAGIRKNLRSKSALLNTASDQQKEAADPNDINEPLGDTPGIINEEEEEESSDEEVGGDDDATLTRYRTRHNEAHEYDDDEEIQDDTNECNEFQDENVNKEPSLEEEAVDVKEGIKMKVESVENIEPRKRVEAVLGAYKLVKSYKYDVEHEKWCEFTLRLPLHFPRVDFSTLLRHEAEKSVVSETAGIKRAFVITKPDGNLMLRTDGSNLLALFPYMSTLDISRIYSNDIYAVSQIYGIEAARAVLVREVRDVFQAYGITVDPRHLLLVADFMTFLGTYEPLSKRGMESACSPLQQMSFESSIAFLQSALLLGRRDLLQSPSSRIMLGRPCGVGTGSFSLYQHLTVT